MPSATTSPVLVLPLACPISKSIPASSRVALARVSFIRSVAGGTEMPNYCYCALPPRADGWNLGLSSAGWSRQWEKEWVWFCLQYTARSFGHLRRLRLCVLNLVTLGGRSFASGRGCRQITVAQSSSWAGDELALGIVCSCLRRLKAKGKKGFSNWSWFLVTSLPPNKRKQA